MPSSPRSYHMSFELVPPTNSMKKFLVFAPLFGTGEYPGIGSPEERSRAIVATSLAAKVLGNRSWVRNMCYHL